MDAWIITSETAIFFLLNPTPMSLFLTLFSIPVQIWCSVNSTPRSKDSTFLTVFDAATHEKKLHYTDLESRVAVILPVHTSVRGGPCSGRGSVREIGEGGDNGCSVRSQVKGVCHK